MTLSMVITLAGLIIWLIFVKVQRMSDGWLAELGKLMFFAGLLAYLIAAGNKVLI